MRAHRKSDIVYKASIVISVLLFHGQMLLVSLQAVFIPAALEMEEEIIAVPEETELSPQRLITEDPLVEAIIQIETGGDPNLVGRAGERGLMQIKRVTWDTVSKKLFGMHRSFDDAFDPNMNRLIGSAYLNELRVFLSRHHQQWSGDETDFLLACYNAGPTTVLQSGFDLSRLPASTQDYIERAKALCEVYAAIAAAHPNA